MNVLRFELRSARTATIAWIITIVLFATMYLSVYPAFSDDVEELRKIFANLPPAMRHVMGVGVENQFSFLAFFGNVFPFITLAGGIMATILGFSTLTREQRSKTTEFLLTKPRTRSRIFHEKITAVILQLIIVQSNSFAMSYFIARLFGASDFSGTRYAMFWLSFALIQYWLFAFALLVSQLVRHVKSPVPLALSTSFGFFITAMFGAIIGDEAIRWITPFRFIDYRRIVEQGTFDPLHVIVALLAIAACLVISFIIYTRKDVPSVS